MRLDSAGRVDDRMGSRTHYVVGSHSAERAAVAADLTVLWRRAQQPGAAQREVLNFSADRCGIVRMCVHWCALRCCLRCGAV